MIKQTLVPGERIHGVIFDLDGTVADTLPVCFAAFRRAFSDFLGRELRDEEIAALFGPSEEGIIQRLVPERWRDCLDRYLELYEREHAGCCLPFSGMEEALRMLESRQTRRAIVTGKGPRSTEISLRQLGLETYFCIVETGSSEGGVKPAAIRKVLAQWGLSAREVAYVGDSPYDMEAAQEAGVTPLGAAWAVTADHEQLRRCGAHAVFRKVRELITWIEPRL